MRTVLLAVLTACSTVPRTAPAPEASPGPGCIADAADGVCPEEPTARNVAGEALAPCGPGTGWHRDGTCRTAPADRGNHSVCAVMTDAFLKATLAQGNDLMTPRPDLRFPGLSAGDRWCLCASRWEQARREGVAPPVKLDATAAEALRGAPLKELRAHAQAR